MDDTAVNYATEIGLDVDVSHFDTNDTEAVDGCSFTIWERDMLDAYGVVQTEDLVSDETGAKLAQFAAYFTVAGPATAPALLATYEYWKDNRKYEDVAFTPETVGAFDNPLGDLRMPGTWHEAGNFPPVTNYPIDDRVSRFHPLDWSNRIDGTTSTFLSELAGYPECAGAEDVVYTSFDMGLDREFDTDAWAWEVFWYEVENLFFVDATIDNILFRDFRPQVGPPHTSIDISLTWTVHPHDGHLLPPGTTIRAGYNHLAAYKDPRFFTSEEDLPPKLREGTVLEPGETFAYVDPFIGPAFLLDIWITAPAEDFPDIGPSVGPDIQPTMPNLISLDPTAANYYPDGYEPRFADQRFADNRVYGPCRDDAGELVPVPDEAYTPPGAAGVVE